MCSRTYIKTTPLFLSRSFLTLMYSGIPVSELGIEEFRFIYRENIKINYSWVYPELHQHVLANYSHSDPSIYLT